MQNTQIKVSDMYDTVTNKLHTVDKLNNLFINSQITFPSVIRYYSFESAYKCMHAHTNYFVYGIKQCIRYAKFYANGTSAYLAFPTGVPG